MPARLNKILTSLLAVSLVGGGLVAAGSAQAATTPPFEPDPSSTSSLSFYDATGAVITSGPTNAPFAAYAVGSAPVRAGDTKAALYFANPQSGVTPSNYYVEAVGANTPNPVTTGPAPVVAAAKKGPVYTSGAGDLTLNSFESHSVIDTTAGYQNVVQVRLRTTNTDGQFTDTYDSADVVVNTDTNKWTEVYPINATAPAGTPGTYVPVTPKRLLDTRYGTGASKVGPVAANSAIALQVTGGAIPAGVSAVAINVTANAPTAVGGSITVYADGTTRPVASNLNFVKGQTVPNLVIAPVGSNGKIDLYNGSAGTVQLIGDVSGYFVGGAPTAAGTFGAVTPKRVLDTRYGTGTAAAAPVAANSAISVQVTGDQVPAGVSAVVINVTANQPSAVGGSITVYADGTSRPVASNLNFVKGQTVPNLVVAPVGSDGKIDLYNGSTGTVNLIGDVSGYFLGGGPSVPGSFGAVTPNRLLDTRYGTGATGPVAAGGTVSLSVVGGTVPSGVTAVVVNVTVNHPTVAGSITVFADGTSRPVASNLNFVANQTVPNLVIAPVGSDGKIDLYNGSTGTVQLIADVSGYITGSG